MASLFWFYSSDRAEMELGYRARPLMATLQDTHAWECRNGKLKPPPGRVPDGSEPPIQAAA
jgi:hypothetical protein